MSQDSLPPNGSEEAIMTILRQALKNNPSLIEKLVKSATGEQAPANQSPESAAQLAYSKGPYYKEVFALQVKPAVDAMLATGQDQVFEYDQCPNLAQRTLQSRIHQSIQYLNEQLDPTGQYSMARLSYEITKEKVGIYLRLHANVAQQSPLTFKATTDKNNAVAKVWRNRLNEFLELADPGETGARLVLDSSDGVALTDTEVESLQEELKVIPGLIQVVTTTTIKVIKLPPSQYRTT